jgi:hypothetical protein
MHGVLAGLQLDRPIPVAQAMNTLYVLSTLAGVMGWVHSDNTYRSLSDCLVQAEEINEAWGDSEFQPTPHCVKIPRPSPNGPWHRYPIGNSGPCPMNGIGTWSEGCYDPHIYAYYPGALEDFEDLWKMQGLPPGMLQPSHGGPPFRAVINPAVRTRGDRTSWQDGTSPRPSSSCSSSCP